nr:VAN3-binding protein-like isoform X2 [Tanacetum cinerariifolium]
MAVAVKAQRSVAGIPPVVATIVAATAAASASRKDEEMAKTDMNVVSASTLVAAQCIEVVEAMGAEASKLYDGDMNNVLGCRKMLLVGDENKNVPLYYHMFDNFQIQFGREEFCLVTGLKFRVEYWADYNDEGPNEYYTRHMRYPRVVAWSSNKKFYRNMLRYFLHGHVPTERLIPGEIEAASGWWVSSSAYFDGRGGPSSFQTPGNNSFFNMGTPITWQTKAHPSEPGSSNWQSQMPAYTPTPNWQPPIPSHPGDAGLCDPNILERQRREQRLSLYMQSPYTPLPPTTELPKKRVGGDDIVITGVHDIGIYFTYENVDSNKQMNAWIEILIRSRPQNADWTVSKSGTACTETLRSIKTDHTLIDFAYPSSSF